MRFGLMVVLYPEKRIITTWWAFHEGTGHRDSATRTSSHACSGKRIVIVATTSISNAGGLTQSDSPNEMPVYETHIQHTARRQCLASV